MKRLILALVCFANPIAAHAASNFDWAYPAFPTHDSPAMNIRLSHFKDSQVFTVPNSSKKYTWKQINDPYGPPDWYPEEHAPLPDIVAHGRGPHVPACILCHLPSGHGHPESASISHLQSQYIIDQMHFFCDGLRNNSRASIMVEMAKDIKDGELKAAANYFATTKAPKYIRVVEAKAAPANHIGEGGARFLDEGSKATVPIPPMMIYEISETDGSALRDDHVGYVEYVPVGSIAKGRTVAMGNHGQFKACASCHGDDYQGHGNVPRLAGRGAYYLIRQLNDMKTGARKGLAMGNEKDGSMTQVTGKLSDQDIINVVAFMASQAP